MEDFLSILRDNNIYVSLSGENLSVRFPKGKIDPALLAALKERKEELKAYLLRRTAARKPAIPQVAESESYELSSAQGRLWLLCQFEGSNAAYNIPGVTRFHGPLDPDALDRAFDQLLDRHQSLRTVFRSDENGQPRQLILSPEALGFRLARIDLRGTDNQQAVLHDHLAHDFRQPFDLGQGPLLRAALYRLEDEVWVFSYVLHHIISDAWSMAVFFRDLLKAYEASLEGKTGALTPLPLHYRDYAAWQRAQLTGNGHRSYWLEQLGGELPVLQLPLDKPRPAIKTYEGGLVRHRFSSELTQNLQALLRQKGCTLFMGVVAGVNALLYKYSGQDDIIVGSPVAGREHSDLEEQIGFYVNTLALRTRLSGSEGFEALLAEVRQTTLKAYEHQGYPFDELVSALSVPHDPGRSALFDVMVALQNAGDEELSTTTLPGGLRLERSGPVAHVSSKFDLLFNFHESEGSLQLSIEYNSDLFERARVERIGEHLEGLLQAAVEKAETPLEDLEYMSEAERKQLLNAFNATADAGYPAHKTIVTLFEEQVTAHPDAIATRFEGTSLGYAELNRKANRLAHHLIARGVKPETLVPLCLERSHDMIISILAILKAGGAYVPIDPEYPDERIDYMLGDTAAPLLITTGAHLDRLARIYTGGLLNLSDTDLLTTEPEHNPGVAIEPGNLAYVIYTSGSTGQPKGAMNEHRALVNRLWWAQDYFRLTPEDSVLQKTTYSFDVSVWELLWPLMAGARLVFARPGGHRDSDYLRALIDEEGITLLHFVPSMLSLFAGSLQAGDCGGLKKILCSGEALTPAQVRFCQEKLPTAELHNLYGPTEAAIDVTCYSIGAAYEGLVPIGRPVANTSIYILDKTGRLVPLGIPGELHIGGIQVARGYLNRDELTAEKFIANPYKYGERLYRTGDLARWLPDGNIEYLGRLDHQVKIRGYRIELGEIEATLERHGQVDQAVVLARTAAEGKELLACIVGDAALELNALRAWLGESLPDYMVPAYFIRLDEMPLTSNGKADRKKLLQLEGAETGGGTAYAAPTNAGEESLARLFAAELSLPLEKTGIHDNFFALGGDSMKGMRLVVKIKKEFGAGITMPILYKYQTIAALAAWLQQNKTEDVQEQEWTAGLQEIDAIRKQTEERYGDRLPADYEDIFPMTPIEQGMIYSSLLRPEAPVYYDQFGFFVQIDDIARFRAGIVQLVRRHQVLRTKYYMHSFERPLKIVLSEANAPVTYEDLSALDEEARKSRLKDYLDRDVATRWNFDDELLWRLRVFNVEGDKYYIVLSFHHAIMDGWSVSTFATELTNLLSSDRQSLPPLRHSYKDYSAIVLGRKRSPAVEAYWKGLLEDYSRNKLPFNYKGLRIAEGRGMRKLFRVLDTDLRERLGRLSATQQVSFKAICLAAHIYLLHIISSEHDVITGVVTHERPELEDGGSIIGCFLNTLPVRIDFGKVTSTAALLRAVHHFLTSSKPNEIHLGEIAALVDRTASAENPIFDTLFNFTDFHTYRDASRSSALSSVASPLTGSWTGATNEMTNTLFDLEVDKTMDRFLLKIKYTPAYFREEDMLYAQDLYVRILESFAADVQAPLLPERLLLPAERDELLFGFNNTIVPYSEEKTLHQLFEEQVLRTPKHEALSRNGRTLSYEELNRRANRVAHYLRAAGIRPGDNVGLLVTRSFDMIIGMFGILKAGAAYVPIDPEYPEDRQEYIISNSGVHKVLLNIRTGLQDRLTSVQFISLGDEAIDGCDDTNPGIAVSSRHQAYTIYTSGSTGRPKGVMIEHHMAVNLVEWVNAEFGVGPDDRLLFVTSMCFDLSVYDVFGLLAVGGTLVIATRDDVQDVRHLQQLMIDERITFWDSVPSTLNYLVSALEFDGDGYVQDRLRLVFLSGDWIPLQLPGRVLRFFPKAEVISLGGATEATVWSNFFRVKGLQPFWSSIPYGVPINNNFFYILNDNLQPVPKGVVGELYIGGAGVAAGYANDPEKTRNAFRPDSFNDRLGGRMYKTGDLGRWTPEGYMELLGRKDNQVKVRGFRVELGEIESVLLKLEGIREAIVNVVKDAAGNNQLCAYVVLLADLDKKEIREHLKNVLPAYMLPEYFVILEALPLNSNGKIDRKALPRPQADGTALRTFEPAVTPLEKNIERIWLPLLNTDRLGLHTDFFELGANSLAVGAFVSRVTRDLGLPLTIREVFLHPTVAGLAALLGERRSSATRAIQPAGERNAYELSSAQQRMHFLSRLDDNSEAYNISGVFALEGRLDRAALEQAFSALLQRHEILRTVFREDADGIVLQHILPHANNSIRYHDLRAAAHKDAVLKDMIGASLHVRFDLAEGPLVHTSLYQLEDEQWVFAYLLHHIITDGWSMEVFIRELMTLYQSYRTGSDTTLPLLRLQYKDYAVWQQEQLAGGILQKHGDYWRTQFAGKIPVLQLPSDRPRPAVKTYNGALHRKTIDKAAAARLRAYVREQEGTLFIGLVTAVNALLSAYTGQEDIILGTSVAGREQPELENGIGLYVNTIALRTRFTGAMTFRDLFSQVRQTTLDAYEHQLYPFDELVQSLSLRRDPSRNELFDVMVVLQNTRIGNSAAIAQPEGLTVSRYRGNTHRASQFDLAFDFFDTGEELVVGIEYNTDLFDAATVAIIADHLGQAIAMMTGDGGRRINELDYRLPAQPAQRTAPKSLKKGIANNLKL